MIKTALMYKWKAANCKQNKIELRRVANSGIFLLDMNIQ